MDGHSLNIHRDGKRRVDRPNTAEGCPELLTEFPDADVIRSELGGKIGPGDKGGLIVACRRETAKVAQE